MKIGNVELTTASPSQVEAGLLGYISATLNDTLALDGLALRKTADGRLTISFPARRDSSGRQHFYLRPLDDITRQEIECQIFRALGLGEASIR